MKKQKTIVAITIFLLLFVNLNYNIGGENPNECETCNSDNEYDYPLMKPDHETLEQWIESYNNAPKIGINQEPGTPMHTGFGDDGGTNFSLLPHLEYTPTERNQGTCGNCWAWAGTGVLGITLDVQEAIKNRLSMQYLNSNYNGGSGSDWACCGGWLADLVNFYNNTDMAIPWSNTNANWQDGSQTCEDELTNVSADTISTTPNYPIISITNETIITQNVTNATAIVNIKNVLNQNKAVWFAYFLPTSDDWNNFFNFWNNQAENATWNPDYSIGNTWDAGGGGHAVLCVGYNDTDPENPHWVMLNSWGTTAGRPNGLFRLDMNMSYSGYFYDPYPDTYYSFYWQTLNVTFNLSIYVDDDGGADYTKIQDAINNATQGDTIIVRDGVYTENVVVNKSLTIQSENGSANCIVQAANSYDHVFNVTSDWINISGFTVKNATGDASGIYLNNVDYCNIFNNNASENSDGIHLDSSNNNTIIGNTANSNTINHGIWLWESYNNTLTNNTANLNNEGGICLDFSNNNTLTNNTANSNNHSGIELFQESHNNTVTNSTVNLNNDSGICLQDSSDYNTIAGNTVNSNNESGISLDSSNNTLIYNNYFNNTNNAGDNGNNIWNISKTLGTNIIGGSYLGGNYWSDYSGVDNDGDGIGDTNLPYNSSGNIPVGGDFLPLVLPGGGPPLVNTTVMGRVNDTMGQNLSGVNVSAFNQTFNWENWSLTNVDGNYSFSTFSGDFVISAVKDGYQSWQQNVYLPKNQIVVLNITLSPSGGGELPLINTTIHGFVNNTEGSFLEGVNVSAYNWTFDWRNYSFTDVNGYFEFDVFAGDFMLSAMKDGYDFWQENRNWPENDTIWENITLTPSGGGDEGEQIIIKGYVYQDMTPDLPVSNANITVRTNGLPDDILNYTLTNWEGHYEMVFQPNQTAVDQGYNQIELLVTADGYKSRSENRDVWWMIDEMYTVGYVDMEDIRIEKIWNTSATVSGSILDKDTHQAIENASVMAEGDNYFFNTTMSNATGVFSIGTIPGEIEFWAMKEGYFVNCTDLINISEGENDIGIIYLEVKPEETSYIVGNLTCNGVGIPFTELVIYDPLHPFEGEKADFPRTNATGYFNISTYPGEFYLLTFAKIIGRRMDGPPLAIGGYENKVISISIGENETHIEDISLNVSEADVIQVDIEFNNWSQTVVNMSKTVVGNRNIVRLMADSDLDGIISGDEVSDLVDLVNSSLTESDIFDMEAQFLSIPLSFALDDVYFVTQSSVVEISGLAGPSQSSNPITVFVNETLGPVDSINEELNLHSLELYGYYANPAFGMNFTITLPDGNITRNAKQELVDISGIGTSNIIVAPYQDPDWNDTYFYESVLMLVGTPDAQVFAELNEGYYSEITLDADGDSDYDYLISKVKFNTSKSGTFAIVGTLRSQSGITIASCHVGNSYGSGSNMVELSFTGENIYRKKIDGPYKVVVDLYYRQEGTFLWFDSMDQTTATYTYSEFDSPPIYFTGEISDSGLDEDNDGLYDYLVISLGVDVGETGSYEFEGDIGTCDYSFQGDPHIAHIRKTVTFVNDGEQTYNMNFDGSQIYEKGRNASIWVNIRVRSFTEGELDEIHYMTEKYFYTEFTSPPSESCTINGSVTNVFGDPLEAEIRLFNEETYSENSTNTNESNGYYSIHTKPGMYNMEVHCTNYSVSLESHHEFVVIGESDENETLTRDIKLVPWWYDTCSLDWMLDRWQYATGENIYLNISSYDLPNSNSSIEIYKEYRVGDEYYGELFITNMTNTTDANGTAKYVINTSEFTNGQYMIQMIVANQSLPTPNVARGDLWGLQISSLALDFDINKDNYRPWSSGEGTYTLTYISDLSEVVNATYEWKIMYWDWMGEHILASDTFTNNQSGNGTFTFDIPSNILDYGDWFDLRFTATDPSGNEVQSWRGFGVTEGSVIENITDFPVGTPGDYDGLALNVTVNVTQSDSYRLSSGLHDQSWWFITGNETEKYLNQGINIVQIYFEGEQIQSSGRDGYYKAWVGLYRSGQWDELDSLEYTTTNSYNHNDFAQPDVRFNTSRDLTYYPIGPENNYDALVVNTSIIASIPGNYTVHGNLHRRELQPGGWYEWYFVAWNKSTNVSITGDDLNITKNVPIRFEGAEIYNSGQQGPYNINLNLHEIINEDWEEWITVYDPEDTIPFNYNQFTKPAACIENITDYGPDANDDLVIGVHINVSDGEQGDYRINGDLHSSDWMWITHDWNETSLNNGINIVNLTFSGGVIYSAGYDGPYKLHVGLERVDTWEWLGGREFDTDPHSYTDFSMPSAVFVGTYSDAGYDEDGDGYYDCVRVTVPVNISETGWYEISGDIYQEDGWDWYWITWGHTEFEINETTTQNITIDFSGYEIMKSGREGQYGISLWLRSQGNELGHLEFTTDTYYYLDEFEQPSVRFTDDSPRGESLSDDGKYINITVAVNASEVGTYYVEGHLHKVITHPGWDEWIYIAFAEKQVSITQTGETEVNVSFDTAMIQGSGYDGPYTVHFDLMDENWIHIDFITDYQTQLYQLTNFSDRPAYFTGEYDDYLYPSTNPEFVRVNVTVYVNESGNYDIGGDLHKKDGWNWNFIAGSGVDQYLDTGNHTVTLQFDAVEILDNIQNLGLDEFNSGSTFDIDVWLRRSGEWTELDHLSNVSKNTYSVSNFSSSFSASIENVIDIGYNSSGDQKYEYLNVTVTVNFTEAGNYELWCDLSKESGNNWYWIGWENDQITITNAKIKNITLQFNGERISSAGYDGPYKLYMELKNLDNGKRLDRYDGETAAYVTTDFVGSSIEFNDSTASVVGVDSDDADCEYDYLLVSVNVTAQEACNIEFRGDLHKESQQSGWQWISWKNEWVSLDVGTTTLTLQFDGEIIRNSELNGPYQVRLELWDTSDWKILDTIESLSTPAYSYDNFQTASALLVEANISDWGIDTDSPTDGLYNYLEVNVSVEVSTGGTYEIMGDLHSDTGGWQWLGWANNWAELDAGTQVVKLQFNGVQIRNKEIDGPYKIRLELRDNTGRILDTVDPYQTSSYQYTDFQSSGVELVSASDRKIGSEGDYLELNVTIDCSTAGTYWVGADLHKEEGWNWQWIAWESTEQSLTATGQQNVTILFSGEMIRNSEIDGPYQIRIELRDTDTWTEQDVIERYTTNSYSYTEFKQPSVSFVSINDWGNDTDNPEDNLYNYLELNITVNCTQADTYWLHADLHKQSGWNWQGISWKGQEISLSGSGEQEVKLQFDGERIYNSEIDGPYQVHLEISNATTWTRLDTYDQYTTNSYEYTDFQRSTILFIENDTSPSDRGVGTAGSYTSLEINVTVYSTSPGTYWLHADLHKQSGGNWQWIAWDGQEITHTGSGNETFTILFDGNQIRNKAINGPYQVRLELCSASGEWKQYDVIEPYNTKSYSYTDFQSAGIELVDASAGSADSIANGNLRINVTVNSSSTDLYEIFGDLHKESGHNWQWISWNSTQVTVSDSGEQTFPLVFDGDAIYESGIDGPYHVRIELRNVGSGTMIDITDRYTTNTYSATDFSAPTAGMNSSETTDYAPNNEYLQVNVTTYSASSTEYQVDARLHGSDWEFIAWNKTTKTISGYDQLFEIQFDGSIINNSGIDPAKVYIEMRRTNDWKLIDADDYDLQGSYSANTFGAGVTIETGTITSSVWDSDGDGYNNSLNVTMSITFDTAGTYEIAAGLRNSTGTLITGTHIEPTSYSGSEQVTLSFDGLKIYQKGLNGPYVVSFISVSKEGSGEIARVTNALTTASYDYTVFEHPDTVFGANLTGTYSSYVIDSDGDGDYDYLIINATVDVSNDGSYDFYGDLYSSDGTTWIAGDYNNSLSLEAGTQAVQLEFEGDEIYDSLTNGPYLLGYIRIGADIDGTWILLDSASNVHTTSSYSYSDFESGSVAPKAPAGVSSVSVSNDPFSPNNDGTKDTTLVTVTATSGQTLHLNIYNSSNTLIRTGLPLSGSGTTYTATWMGKDDTTSVVSDGTYRIKVTDEATGDQNHEVEETTTVVVDTAAPTGSTLTINGDNSYANTTSVTLSVSATDTSPKKMRFKNAGGNWTDWDDFQSSKSWTLTSTEGSKTVSFQAKDTAGNIATAVDDSITLDTTKPSNVNITITGKGDTPSTHTNELSVTLSISAEDATSGLEYMMIANDVAFTDGSWETYATSKEWTLTSGDATKTVYLKVKDRAGKVSDIVSDSIILDTTAPTGLGIQINSDQTYTNSSNVTLTLSATGAAKMRFSNNGSSWSSWESYSTEKTGWALSSGDGTKTVYFKAKDSAGNIASNVTDTIILDTTAPTISSVSSSGITQTSATITWTTNEGATTYVEYGTTTSYGSNTTLNTTKVTSHSQIITGLTPGTTYHYRVKSRDTAGNERTSSDKTFPTTSGADTTPPDAITGLSVTDKANAEKTLTLSWTQSGASDFAGYKVYRKTSSFTNVSASGVQLLTTITTKSTTAYDDTTATDDTTFYYAVTAIDTATPPNENQSITSVSGASVDDKAPTTTDNIPVGWQTSSVTVTLTAVDNGKGVNKTYYTTDGSDPSNESNSNRTQYTSPFTVGADNPRGDGIWTIKYYSYDKNTTPNVESVNTKTLKVDTADPDTNDDAPTGWQTSSVTVTLDSNDATSGVKKIYYTKDGSTPTIASSQYSAPIVFTTNGAKTLKYFARDNATNDETVKTATISIDATPPTVTIAYSNSRTYYKDADIVRIYANFTETGSGINESSVKITINTSGTDVISQPMSKTDITHYYYDWNVPSGSEGNVNVSISAQDNASSPVGGTPWDTSKYIDNTVPSVSSSVLTAPNGGEAVSGTYSITWDNASISDTNLKSNPITLYYSNNSGSSWTQIATDGANDGSYSWNTTELSAGSNYLINITAEDEAENVGYDVSNATFTVDNDAPTIDTITGDTTGTTGDTTTISVTFSSDVTTATMYYKTASAGSWSSTSILSGSAGIAIPSDSTESWYYYVTVDDAEGNGPVGDPSTDGSVYYTVTVTDNDKPVCSWVSHPTSGTTGESVLVNLTVADNIGVTGYNITVDSNLHTMTKSGDSYTYTINVPSGSTAGIVYSCNFTDLAGNYNDTGNTTITVTDNDESEIANVTASPTSQDAGSYINITCDVTDSVGVNVVKVNLTYPDSSVVNATMNEGSWYYNATYSMIGTYYYFIWVNDTSGNSNKSATSNFTISGVNISAMSQQYYKQYDTIYINGTIFPAEENKWIGIEVRDSANQEIYYNQTQTNSTGQFSTYFNIGYNETISDGVCTIYASYGDTRDNRTFTYDGTSPTSSISTPASDDKFNDLATISGTASDGTSGVTQVEIQIANSTHYWNGSAWVATAAWLTATGTTSWSYDTSSVDWVACGADASITIKSRATDNANNVETPGAGNTWTYGVTTSITTTAGDIGGYHGFNITWNDVSMSKYKVYYDTSAITDTSGLTAKATVTGATTYECEDMPSGTWGQTIYFAVTTVDSNDVEANSTFIGNTPSSKIWAYKMEITGLQEIHNTTGEIGWEMHYKSRYLNGSLSGKAILECLGPGIHPNVPNMTQWVSRSTMSISSFLETGKKDAYISKTHATGDYKGWNMLWSCLPSESGYWEAYADIYKYSPITVS